MRIDQFVLTLLLVAAPAPLLAQSPSQDASRGEKAYRELACGTCHGTTGAGGGIAGPKLAPELLPWEAFEAQVRQPARRMPPYRRVALPEQDLADIYTYLRSIRPSERADSIPQLRH
jgi:mono/diheme cytochrome c family protein